MTNLIKRTKIASEEIMHDKLHLPDVIINVVSVCVICGFHKKCDFVDKHKGCFKECNWYKQTE